LPETRGHLLATLRLHDCFLKAPLDVLRALVGFMGAVPGHDSSLIRDFAEAHMAAGLSAGARPAPRLRSRGRIHDLHALLEGIRTGYFPGDSVADVRITYGQGSTSLTRRRSIHYGSYHYVSRTITIHPLLDSREVPEWFVSFVIYHELIHAILPEPSRTGGRRRIHDAEFLRLERAHPDYARAQAFAREFLKRFQ
jgi:hypothetical protein